MDSHRAQRITIVGAGLVGSLLAILLARRGYRVHLLERRPDPRDPKNVVGGRSINLALSDRGLLALDKAGLADDIAAVSIPMKGRMVHAVNGAGPFLPYGVGDQAIRSVSRGGLNNTLIDLAAREKNVTITFGARVTGVDVRTASATLEGGARVDGDVILGGDGAFSAVRLALQLGTDRFDYSQDYLAHGYKELTIAKNADGSHALDKNALHIWPRSSFMLIGLPNQDGTFTCTFFFALDGATDSFAALTDPVAARAYFAQVFPDALARMPTFDEDWVRNPVSSLVTVRCQPWSHAGKTLVLGDAAHAIVPFFGQGMNAGFEDCRVLIEILDETQDDWARAMPLFERARKENADAIAVLAIENFTEMRDKVADPVFLRKRMLERKLASLMPHLVTPLYTMVTFSPQLPYADALRRGRAQDRLLDALVPMAGIEDDDAALRRLTDEHLGATRVALSPRN
ncbi:MAG TPA: NAD(P)/FAD-dependent oxidoreductase [Myxococcota bacterium]